MTFRVVLVTADALCRGRCPEYAERVRRDDVSCAPAAVPVMHYVEFGGGRCVALYLSGQGWSDTRMARVVRVDEPLMGRCFFDCVVPTRAPGRCVESVDRGASCCRIACPVGCPCVPVRMHRRGSLLRWCLGVVELVPVAVLVAVAP